MDDDGDDDDADDADDDGDDGDDDPAHDHVYNRRRGSK